MSILMVTLDKDRYTQTDLDVLVGALTEVYAKSLACLPDQVRVFVEHNSSSNENDLPNIEFLVPEGTPLAGDSSHVDNLKRQFDHVLGMWPHAIEMLQALHQRSSRPQNKNKINFSIGSNAK